MIVSSEVRAQWMSSSSHSYCSNQPNEQELEILRLCEEMRQQREYFMACIKHQQGMFQVSIDDAISKFICRGFENCGHSRIYVRWGEASADLTSMVNQVTREGIY